MFDIGWTEMLVISVIAIVVVGPKDLPAMLRTVGRYVGKAKRMAREFQTQFDDAVRDSDLDEVRKSFDDLKSANPTSEIGKALSPLTEAADDLKNTVEKSDLNDTGSTKSMDDVDRMISGDENSILDDANAAAIATKPSASPASKKAAKPKARTTASKRAAKPKAKTTARAKTTAKAKTASASTKKPAKKAATANG